MRHPDTAYVINTSLLKSTSFCFGLCHQQVDLKLYQTNTHHVIKIKKLTRYILTPVQLTNATAFTSTDIPKGSQHVYNHLLLNPEALERKEKQIPFTLVIGERLV